MSIKELNPDWYIYAFENLANSKHAILELLVHTYFNRRVSMEDNLKWRVFLALEKEFIETQNFVEHSKNNYKAYSIRFRSILLQTCAEIESILKEICKIQKNKRSNMGEYKKYLSKNHQDFFEICIEVPLYNRKIYPWNLNNSSEKTSIDFWNAYNAVKHEDKLESANLENTQNSLAALLAILLAFYIKKGKHRIVAGDGMKLPSLYAVPRLVTDIIGEEDVNLLVKGFN